MKNLGMGRIKLIKMYINVKWKWECRHGVYVRPDVMTGVWTPVPPLYMCEFMMTLSFCLSKKNNEKVTLFFMTSIFVRKCDNCYRTEEYYDINIIWLPLMIGKFVKQCQMRTNLKPLKISWFSWFR